MVPLLATFLFLIAKFYFIYVDELGSHTDILTLSDELEEVSHYGGQSHCSGEG
jgi:hypothetical protein